MPLIAISGPTGVGKTTVARCIAARSASAVIPEPLPLGLIELVASEPARYCGALQWEFVAERTRAIETACSQLEDGELAFVDRTLSEDRDVFFNLHHGQGRLTVRELNSLVGFVAASERSVPSASAVVYLTARTDTLRQRLLSRGSLGIIVDSLETQVALYHSWYARCSAPSVSIDTTHLSMEEMSTLADWICASAPQVVAGNLPTHPRHDWAWRGGSASSCEPDINGSLS